MISIDILLYAPFIFKLNHWRCSIQFSSMIMQFPAVSVMNEAQRFPVSFQLCLLSFLFAHVDRIIYL